MIKLTLAQIPRVKQAILQKRQNFTCAMCTTTLTISTGCLDHDHSTGMVRGVLCRNCNGIEGKIKNLVTRGRRGMAHEDYLGQVLRYWIRHKTDQTGLLYPSHLTTDEKRIKTNAKARKVRALKKKAVKSK